MSVHAPDRRRRDLDNVLKSTLDSLTHAGVWDDDSQIDQLSVERGFLDKGKGFIRITITPLDTIAHIQ
jgi:crossover junction endodeoxyribonuclease RusA